MFMLRYPFHHHHLPHPHNQPLLNLEPGTCSRCGKTVADLEQHLYMIISASPLLIYLLTYPPFLTEKQQQQQQQQQTCMWRDHEHTASSSSSSSSSSSGSSSSNSSIRKD